MAGPVASSSSASLPEMEPRPQAGALPSKRGEIGYVEEVHGAAPLSTRETSSPLPALPERHPADRDAPPTAAAAESSPASNDTPNPTSNGGAAASASDAASTRLRKFFQSKTIPSIGGIRLKTLATFLVQCLLCAATIVGWVLTIKLAGKPSEDGEEPSITGTSAIFIHVVYAIATLAQLLFLERRLYRVRAERYAHLHPGEMLPSYHNRGWLGPGDASIAFSPWNRPPLPTYAAALAQSGVGTGDVEDHLIAAPPPPAYGHTRGSVMLLSGFMRNSLLANRPSSVHSVGSVAIVGPDGTPVNDRPASYASHDSQWDAIQDAERARRLEDTLSTLENGTASTVGRT